MKGGLSMTSDTDAQIIDKAKEMGVSMAGIANVELLKKSPSQFSQYGGKISTDSIVGRLSATIDGK
jgi:hypothetical protein